VEVPPSVFPTSLLGLQRLCTMPAEMAIESVFSWPEPIDMRFSKSNSTVCIESLSKMQFVLTALFRLLGSLLWGPCAAWLPHVWSAVCMACMAFISYSSTVILIYGIYTACWMVYFLFDYCIWPLLHLVFCVYGYVCVRWSTGVHILGWAGKFSGHFAGS
jgi:hypothetical protein